MVYLPPVHIENAIQSLKLHALVFAFFAFSLVVIFAANAIINYFINRKER